MTDTTPPVEPGETRTVTIDSTGDEGDGIARAEDGYVLFVADAAPKEDVEVVVGEVFESYALCHLVNRKSAPRESPQDDPQGQDLAGASSKYEVRPDEPV